MFSNTTFLKFIFCREENFLPSELRDADEEKQGEEEEELK